MNNHSSSVGNRGVISTIILIVAALVILGYFGISFRGIIASPIIQDNFKYAWEIFSSSIASIVTWIQEFFGKFF
ncbi:MAG: hypothetical protein K0S38_350 [Candidatus Paceibacter sp.]|jgi:hypothetical protein|nr:hypothetical protein [Candidatus Paceibacter sp.]